MKKLVLLSAIILGGVAYNNKANAQISIHLGFNVPVRHVYAPAPVATVYNNGYDDSDDYYYLPDVEAYYSVPNHCYYYNDGNAWVSAAYLPGAYRNYDWRNARRFEIRGRRPYMHHNVYRQKWGGNDNRGNWGRGDDNYAGRGFDNRNNNFNREDHRNGGGFGERYKQNTYGQSDNSRNDHNYGNGHQSQNNSGGRGRGGWDGQSAGGNSNGQHNQNEGQPQQPQNNGGGQSNQNGGGYNRGNGGSGSQPANQNGGGHNRGDKNSGGQVAQNAMRNNARMNEAMRPARF